VILLQPGELEYLLLQAQGLYSDGGLLSGFVRVPHFLDVQITNGSQPLETGGASAAAPPEPHKAL
jgi:hypothetical protein